MNNPAFARALSAWSLAALLFAAPLFAVPARAQPAAAPPVPSAPVPSAPVPAAPVPAAPEQARRYAETITPDELAAHLYLFASDWFEGRETGARGQKLAAAYLAAAYRKLGAAPLPGGPALADPRAPEAYYQPVPVYARQVQSAALEATRDGRALPSDGAALLSGGAPEAAGGVVFAGYGIADAALGYDDYAALEAAGLSASGKWVLALPDEPLADDSTSLLPTPGRRPSAWTTGARKLEAARAHGALGVLLLAPEEGGPEGSWAAAAARRAGSRPLGRMSLSRPAEPPATPPVYVVSRAFADALLGGEGAADALARRIDAARAPVAFGLPGVAVRSRIRSGVVEVPTENVLAYVEGSDPALKHEAVVLSAHYDHIGIAPGGGPDVIHNGADDDGSGTVALLEIAEAFVQARRDGHGPRRSVVFISFTGEEKGLLGSDYYASTDPRWPLEHTVANLNIDMIGRFDPTHPTGSRDYVYLIGSRLISQDLHDLNAAVNESLGTGLTLDERFNAPDDPNRFYARSDHWNFGKRNIPFIFFFTGTHEDYHAVGDEPRKIAYERMARIARLIFGTAWQAANQDARPAVTGQGFN